MLENELIMPTAVAAGFDMPDLPPGPPPAAHVPNPRRDKPKRPGGAAPKGWYKEPVPDDGALLIAVPRMIPACGAAPINMESGEMGAGSSPSLPPSFPPSFPHGRRHTSAGQAGHAASLGPWIKGSVSPRAMRPDLQKFAVALRPCAGGEGMEAEAGAPHTAAGR